MRRAFKFLFLSAVMALFWAPTQAYADGFVAPFAGVNTATSTNINKRGDYGVNAGWMGAGVAGWEVDFGYSPSYFGDDATYGSNHVWDVMGNFIVGVPVGGQRGPGIRPYATVGFGLLKETIAAAGTHAEISYNDPGINVGGGVMGYFGDHVGLRGDVRYFRDVHSNTTSNSVNINFGGFHYVRASIGIVFR
jgi:outer membrane protein with beta-barrel domain